METRVYLILGGRCYGAKMGAPVATRHNPILKEFYERLLVACMRKLLSIINAVMRDRVPWHLAHLRTP
jgi:transposase